EELSLCTQQLFGTTFRLLSTVFTVWIPRCSSLAMVNKSQLGAGLFISSTPNFHFLLFFSFRGTLGLMALKEKRVNHVCHASFLKHNFVRKIVL
ncbi:hypothetical protein E2320_000310, partial [Naja naja]